MLSAELNGRLPIIGVGGIDSVIAREKIAAGHRWCRSIPDLFLKARR
jgi:dihydroorotate dehydrogenase